MLRAESIQLSALERRSSLGAVLTTLKYLSLKRRVVQVSCPQTACDWTTRRKRSHGNSNQLTAKWGVGCCIVFMATDDVTERVVYKRRGSARGVLCISGFVDDVIFSHIGGLRRSGISVQSPPVPASFTSIPTRYRIPCDEYPTVLSFPSPHRPVDVVFSHCPICHSLELYWQHVLQLTSAGALFFCSKTKIQCSHCQLNI